MKSQLEEINEKLLAIKKNVTTQDRKDAVTEFSISKVRISLYLNGKGESIDTGMKLFKFFSKKIADRQELLSA